MSKKQYFTLRILFLIVLVLMANLAISEGGWYWGIFLITFAVAFLLSMRYLSPKKLKEAIVDERTYRIQEKASAMAIRIFTLAMLYAGAILLYISSRTDSELSQPGFILLYSVCGLMLLRLILQFYYSRRL
jgi:uncharacterized membrane protein